MSFDRPKAEWPPPGSKEATLLAGMNRADRRAFLREHRAEARDYSLRVLQARR